MAKKGKRILIAEDEKPLSRALELKLTSAGYQPKVANNGQEAIEFITKENFDLVVLDLIMPKVDGFGVLEEIKKAGKKIKIIVLSNLNQAGDSKRAKQLGALGYFVKSNTPIGEIVGFIKRTI
ncbi:MAG: response regulator [Patescibacteria group bacterium]